MHACSNLISKAVILNSLRYMHWFMHELYAYSQQTKYSNIKTTIKIT